MKLPALFLSLALAAVIPATTVFAQQRGGDREPRGGGKNQGTSKDQRERMRQDMRNVYQDKGGQKPPPQRQMSPQEREQLRRDIQNANKDLKR